MNFKLDIWTIIAAGAIVLAGARVLTGGMGGSKLPPSDSTPTDGPLVAPINDDEYADVLDDELFDGVTA